jgi:endonuclease/exonuclease/phosphatase (EEP) superfamily protein YafD
MSRTSTWVRIWVLLGVSSMAATVAAVLARQFWAFDLFAHFRVQLAAAQVLLVLIFLARRRRAWAVLLLAGVGVNAAAIWPYLAPAASIAAEGAALRIGFANVERRNTEGGGLVASMSAAAPDLLAVIEYSEAWAERLRPLTDAYPFRIELPRDDNFGIALFSRMPLLDGRSFELEGHPAIAVSVEYRGTPVRVVAAHLMPPMSAAMAARRQRQLDALAAQLDATTEPTVLVGDFNLSPYSPHFGAFLADTSLQDAAAGQGLRYTWPAFMPLLGIPIDHCLTSRHWHTVNYRRLPAYGSDHLPVVVDLALSTNP